MMDDPMQKTRPNDKVRERLEAYSETHLAPDPAAVVRIRLRVMAEARARLTPATVSAERTQPIPIRTRRVTWGRRRTVSALLAASLALVLAAGATLAAEAGGPLYGLRLWVETVALPADPAARAEADLSRLDDRMEEAVRGAAAGNESAVRAALAAYRDILDDAVAAAGDEPTPAGDLQKAVDRQLVVLQGLLDKVPPQARDSIQRAIDKQSETVHKPAPGVDKPKPTKTPTVQPTPKPGRNGGPTHTPPGRPTAHPGGGQGSGSDNSNPKVKPTP
jgi:hypothetical protein